MASSVYEQARIEAPLSAEMIRGALNDFAEAQGLPFRLQRGSGIANGLKEELHRGCRGI